MTRSEYKLVLGVLKKTLKAQGYTYARLGKKIGVSEATVRRIFAGYECNIRRLFDICDGLGISFLETVQFALGNKIASFFLSVEQEEYFAKNPRDYGFFRELYYGKSLTTVCNEWGLTRTLAFRKLLRLERLGLLVLDAENEFRFLVSGQLKWAEDGPMVRALLRGRCTELLDRVLERASNKDTCFQAAEVELTRDDLESLIGELNSLAVKYGKLSAGTRHMVPAKDRCSVGWVFGVTPFTTDWKKI